MLRAHMKRMISAGLLLAFTLGSVTTAAFLNTAPASVNAASGKANEESADDEEEFAGEIGEVLNGTKQGRTSEEDITIFDATGLAALDMATAKVAIELANAKQRGVTAEI